MSDYLIQLTDYERWANRRVIDALAPLPNPPERAVALMGHILSAQHIWYSRLMQESAHLSVWEAIPISWMIETAERQHQHIRGYLLTLDPGELTRPLSYVNTRGVAYQNTPLDILTHMSHHAAYHRGQIVQLIRPLLAEAPVTDYVVWKRDA